MAHFTTFLQDSRCGRQAAAVATTTRGSLHCGCVCVCVCLRTRLFIHEPGPRQRFRYVGQRMYERRHTGVMCARGCYDGPPLDFISIREMHTEVHAIAWRTRMMRKAACVYVRMHFKCLSMEVVTRLRGL